MRTPWKSGPADGAHGPLVISVTDFTVFRWRDLPAILLAGLRLRRAWPRMPGAVGLWLWLQPLRRRGGSVSLWEREDDLRHFVLSPAHREIVRANRGRGSLVSMSWVAERPGSRELWREARRRLDQPRPARP